MRPPHASVALALLALPTFLSSPAAAAPTPPDAGAAITPDAGAWTAAPTAAAGAPAVVAPAANLDGGPAPIVAPGPGPVVAPPPAGTVASAPAGVIAPRPPVVVAPPPRIAVAPPRTPKNPQTAQNAALIGSSVSLGLLVAGIGADNAGLAGLGFLSMLFAPSAGHFYAGQPMSLGFGLRLLSPVVLFGGASLVRDCSTDTCSGDYEPVAVASLALLMTGVVLDLAQAPEAARRYNQRHGLQLQLSPTMLQAARHQVPALGLTGSF